MVEGSESPPGPDRSLAQESPVLSLPHLQRPGSLGIPGSWSLGAPRGWYSPSAGGGWRSPAPPGSSWCSGRPSAAGPQSGCGEGAAGAELVPGADLLKKPSSQAVEEKVMASGKPAGPH